jgi:hypothetical protein
MSPAAADKADNRSDDIVDEDAVLEAVELWSGRKLFPIDLHMGQRTCS